MIRVVLDTSVIVSAVISPNGPNAQVLDLIVNGELRPCLTQEVLDEYRRVFEYDRLKHLSRRRIATLMKLLRTVSVMVHSPGRLRISSHDEDNRIYECALAAKARYIVTENAKHFKQSYKTARIVTARQLLEITSADRPRP
jgi:putative PIN family toxin of toxin-antitoxin system